MKEVRSTSWTSGVGSRRSRPRTSRSSTRANRLVSSRHESEFDPLLEGDAVWPDRRERLHLGLPVSSHRPPGFLSGSGQRYPETQVVPAADHKIYNSIVNSYSSTSTICLFIIFTVLLVNKYRTVRVFMPSDDSDLPLWSDKCYISSGE